jgi:hypothetical protein
MCHLQIESVSMSQLLYWEDRLYTVRKKDQVLNLEERHVLFCPILNNVIVLEVLLFISTF